MPVLDVNISPGVELTLVQLEHEVVFVSPTPMVQYSRNYHHRHTK